MATHHKTELSLDDGSTYVVATADIEAGPNLSFAVTGQLPGSYVCRLRITPVAGGTPVVSDSFVATFGGISANGSQSIQLENASAVTSMLASIASNQSIQNETLVAVSLQMASVASLQSGQTEAFTVPLLCVVNQTQTAQTEAAASPNYNAIVAESIQASQLELIIASMLQNGIVVASQSVQAESITSTISRSGTLASVQAVQAETIIEKTSSLALVTSAQSAQTETGVEVTKRLGVVASIQAAQSETAVTASAPANALVPASNTGFESGVLSPWTDISNNTGGGASASASVISSAEMTGSKAVQLAAVGGNDTDDNAETGGLTDGNASVQYVFPISAIDSTHKIVTFDFRPKDLYAPYGWYALSVVLRVFNGSTMIGIDDGSDNGRFVFNNDNSMQPSVTNGVIAGLPATVPPYVLSVAANTTYSVSVDLLANAQNYILPGHTWAEATEVRMQVTATASGGLGDGAGGVSQNSRLTVLIDNFR